MRGCGKSRDEGGAKEELIEARDQLHRFPPQLHGTAQVWVELRIRFPTSQKDYQRRQSISLRETLAWLVVLSGSGHVLSCGFRDAQPRKHAIDTSGTGET